MVWNVIGGRDARGDKVGLVLPGGGARSAYQVGVLRAIAEIWPREAGNPFPIITGTSAGAINATVLASNALDFHRGVARLDGVWSHFTADKVYRTDPWSLGRTALHWMVSILAGGLGRGNPRALLDNSPLRKLLETHIRFARIQQAIDSGALDALALTASAYTSARSVTFFQGKDELEPWGRTRREGRPVELNLDHLMASAALPFIFPAVRLGPEYFGDGSMRQTAPLSPAVHLGADRLLIIGVRSEGLSNRMRMDEDPRYPSLAQIGGFMLDTLFMDAIYADLERLTRLNQVLEQVPRTRFRTPSHDLRRIEALLLVPSEDVLDIATRHVKELPRSVRLLLSGMGGLNVRGRPLISYLLFEAGFCGALLDLGYRDAIAHRERILRFLQGEPTDALSAPDHVRSLLDEEEESTQAEE